MAEIKKINEINYLINNDRVFFPSKNINIFPCSRRGQYSDTNSAEYYDPEARLNTERTNRLRTAINGFTDSFIVNKDNDTLVFVLAGYWIDVKKFAPADIAEALGITDETTNKKIYAHLSLHEGISLNVEGYFTEILYRQSTKDTQKNYLDVTYSENGYADDFFVGVSFTKEPVEDEEDLSGAILKAHNLELFEKSDSAWEPVQTSLLPKIEHGTTPDSIIIGDITANNMRVPLTFRTDASTQTVNIQKLAVVSTSDFDQKLTAKGDLEVKGTATTPTLKVNTITSASTVEADPVTVNDNLNVLGQTRTPTLKTNLITSDNTEIVVDRVLKVDTINSDSTNGLTIKRATELEKTLNVEGATTVNDTITAEKIVTTKIDNITGEDKGEVKTPKLRVNKITSDNSDIIVDDKGLIISRDLSVLMKKSADPKDKAAVATIDKAVIGDLIVQKDDTNLTKSTGKITADNLTVSQYINVGSPVIPTTTAGDVVAKNSIYAENNIVAKNTLKAPAIYQTVNSSDKPVPFIDIVEQANGQWQLQISRASTIAKN